MPCLFPFPPAEGTLEPPEWSLEVGELLEEWTRKKSVADLARCMSLNVDRVWLRTAQGEVLVPVSQIQPGDAVVPVDGLVLEGEVTVNQASLTGESIPVPKRPGGAVYAGTVVEEGECVLEVKQASGQPPIWRISWCPIPSPGASSALSSPGMWHEPCRC